MVRTSGGIRISAGKSSKKSGGGASSGGSSRSASASTGKSSGSTRLPPIPHCEAPSWQKPITNFFISDAGPSKNGDVEPVQDEERSIENKGSLDESVDSKMPETNEVTEKDNDTIEDEQPMEKRRKIEEGDKENLDDNMPTSS